MATIIWTLTNPPEFNPDNDWDVFFFLEGGTSLGQEGGLVTEPLTFNINIGTRGFWLFFVEGVQFEYPSPAVFEVQADQNLTLNWATQQVTGDGGNGNGGDNGGIFKGIFSDTFKVVAIGIGAILAVSLFAKRSPGK